MKEIYVKYRHLFITLVVAVLGFALMSTSASAEVPQKGGSPSYDASDGYVYQTYNGPEVEVFDSYTMDSYIYRPARVDPYDACGDLAPLTCLSKQRTGFVYTLYQVTDNRTPTFKELSNWTTYFEQGGNKTDAINMMFALSGLNTMTNDMLANVVEYNAFDNFDYNVVNSFQIKLASGETTPRQLVFDLIAFTRSLGVRLHAFEDYTLELRNGFDLGRLTLIQIIPPCGDPVSCNGGGK